MLKDRKLTLEPSFWFIPVKNGYPQIESKYIRFELDKTPESERTDEQKATFEEIKNEWNSVVNNARTEIENYDGYLNTPDLPEITTQPSDEV